MFEKSPYLSPPRESAGNVKESEEAQRIRKGKNVANPSEVAHAAGSNPFPQTYDFNEANLVAVLAGDLPQPTPNVGYIWQAGFLPQFPNSIAMHLPGFLNMQNPDNCPNDIDAYSFEMFRANQLPYMVKRMKTNPVLAIGEAVSHVFEMALCWFIFGMI